MELTPEIAHAIIYYNWTDNLEYTTMNAIRYGEKRTISRKYLEEILVYLKRKYHIFYRGGELLTFRKPEHYPNKPFLFERGWIEL